VLTPTVTAINPKAGPTAGGQTVTITGTNLEGATASSVKFGAISALELKPGASSTQIEAVSPPGAAGSVNITVTTAGGTSANTVADDYLYVAPPTITGLNPTKGGTAGGNTVIITGTNLVNPSGLGLSGPTVKFGAKSATVKGAGALTKLEVTAPDGAAGTVDVTVTTAGGTSANTAADDYTYVAPQSLTVTKAGDGSGSVICNGGACAGTYPFGSKVTLAATADSGSSFTGWSGGGCTGTGPCTVTIEAATAVTATFTAESRPPDDCSTNPAKCPPPPPPPPPPVAKVVGSKAPYSSGKASLTIACEGSGLCKGTVKLSAKVKQGKKLKKVVIGSASYEVVGGQSKTIKVKISNGAAKKQLNKGKSLNATPSGEGLTGPSSIKIKPTAKKKK